MSAALLLLAGCGDDGGAAVEEALDGAVGYGEQRDVPSGWQSVAGVVRLAAATADGPDVGDDDQLVGAVVARCASRSGSGTVLRERGWSAVLDDGSSVTSDVAPVPATEGAPPLASDGRVEPGSCGWGRVLFVVPRDRRVVGVHYEATGARTATWRASDRRPEDVR